jgi:hypothetical protein
MFQECPRDHLLQKIPASLYSFSLAVEFFNIFIFWQLKNSWVTDVAVDFMYNVATSAHFKKIFSDFDAAAFQAEVGCTKDTCVAREF